MTSTPRAAGSLHPWWLPTTCRTGNERLHGQDGHALLAWWPQFPSQQGLRYLTAHMSPPSPPVVAPQAGCPPTGTHRDAPWVPLCLSSWPVLWGIIGGQPILEVPLELSPPHQGSPSCQLAQRGRTSCPGPRVRTVHSPLSWSRPDINVLLCPRGQGTGDVGMLPAAVAPSLSRVLAQSGGSASPATSPLATARSPRAAPHLSPAQSSQMRRKRRRTVTSFLVSPPGPATLQGGKSQVYGPPCPSSLGSSSTPSRAQGQTSGVRSQGSVPPLAGRDCA